ncbi:unnamed protein product, partial [Rhizophagus irregularis]
METNSVIYDLVVGIPKSLLKCFMTKDISDY